MTGHFEAQEGNFITMNMAAKQDSTEQVALLFAWKLYFDLNDAYQAQKNNHRAIRLWMVLLSLLASVLAVLLTQDLDTWFPLLKIVWLIVFLPGIIGRAVLHLKRTLFYTPELSKKAMQARQNRAESGRERARSMLEGYAKLLFSRQTGYSLSRASRATRNYRQADEDYRSEIERIKLEDPRLNNRVRYLNSLIPLVVVVAALAVTRPILAIDINRHADQIQTVARVILVALPIALGSLLAYASEFTPSKLWVIYRHTAQRIQREIYMFRACAGKYKAVDSTDKGKKLLGEIDTIKNSTDNLIAIAPFLNKGLLLSKLDLIAKLHNAPNSSVAHDIQYLIEQARNPASPDEKTDGDVPDDGLSAILSGDDYIRLRIKDRRAWYGAKINQSYTQTKRTRQAILLFSALGAVVAGISLSVAWIVVVTTAITTAITTWHQLTMNSTSLDIYQNAAYAIDQSIAQWQVTLPEQQKHDYPALVETIEATLQNEEDEWMKYTIQIQAHIDKSLSDTVEKLKGDETSDQSDAEKQPEKE